VLHSNRSNGVKLKDAALVGYPWQVVVGAKSEGSQEIEVKRRRDGQTSYMTLEELVEASNGSLAGLCF